LPPLSVGAGADNRSWSPRVSLVTRGLHNHTVFELQRWLYQNGRPMLILPIQV